MLLRSRIFTQSALIRDALVLAALTICVFLAMLVGMLHVATQPGARLAGMVYAAQFGALADAYRSLPAAEREPYLQAVVDASGDYLMRDDPARWGLSEPQELIPRLVVGALRAALPGETIGYSGGASHQIWLALPAEEGKAHWVRVPNLGPEDDWMSVGVVSLTGFALLAPLGAAYLAWRVRHRASRVSQAMDTVMLPDSAPAVEPSGSAIAQNQDLEGRLQAMSERLVQLQRERAGVLAGVSADLRGGMAALRASAPQALDDDGQAPRLLNAIRRVADQLDAFAGAVQDEAGQEVDISALIGEVVAAAARPEQHPGSTVVLRLTPLPALRLRPEATRRALAEVLDNAFRYGGGSVEMRSDSEPGAVVVQVLDRGEPLSDAELALVGRPFFRTDAVRSRSLGAGVGLTIARRNLDAQGGSLHIDRRPGGGLRVEIRLPTGRGARS